MMPQSINKKKIYFYLFTLIFLTTSFNFNITKITKNLIIVKNIDILGLSEKEKKYLKNEVNIFKNRNIYFIDKKEFTEILDVFNFLDNYLIQRIFPSKIIISANKTKFIAMTIIDGKKFYIGDNGKLTLESKVENESKLPIIFGKFPIDEFLNLRKILIKQNLNLNKIEKYFYHKSKRWDIRNNYGTLIMLSSKNLEDSLITYKSLIDKKQFDNSKIIDLRITKRIIITNEKK